MKLEGTKELKGGGDCQAEIGVLLEPCFVNLSTLYLSAIYNKYATKHYGKYENDTCAV